MAQAAGSLRGRFSPPDLRACLYIPVAAFTLWLCFYSVCFVFLFGGKYLTRPRGAAGAEPQRGGDWPVSGRTGHGEPGPAWGLPCFSSWSLLLGGPANRQDVRGSGAGPRPPAPRSASVPSEAGPRALFLWEGRRGPRTRETWTPALAFRPAAPAALQGQVRGGVQAPVSRIRRLCCPPPRGSQRVGHA